MCALVTGVQTCALPISYAVVDLKLGDGNGLDVVSAIRQARQDARVVMLTGYGNIATAVAAVKAGAVDYLPKPADADDVDRALRVGTAALPAPPADPMSAARARSEHIQRVFALCHPPLSD